MNELLDFMNELQDLAPQKNHPSDVQCLVCLIHVKHKHSPEGLITLQIGR